MSPVFGDVILVTAFPDVYGQVSRILDTYLAFYTVLTPYRDQIKPKAVQNPTPVRPAAVSKVGPHRIW